MLTSKICEFSRLFRLNNNKTIINYCRKIYAQTRSSEVTIEPEQLNVSVRVIKKRPHKPPFMKNVFLANFDTDALAFPEVLDNEEKNIIDNKVNEVDAILSEVDINNQKITNEIKNQLKNTKIFGLQTSQLVDGLELGVTEAIRILEAVSKLRSFGFSLKMHQLAVNAISSKGKDEIIKKHLLNLSKGDSIAAFCLLEEFNYDPILSKTKAVLSNDEKHWILNGNKSWVVNGGQGDVFIVVATTIDAPDSPFEQDNMSVFVVEKSSPGVVITPCKTTGFKELDIANISFTETPVPVGNILGDGLDSSKILRPLLSELRLNTGPNCIALMHQLLNKFDDYAIKTKCGNIYLSETDTLKDKLAKINVDLYAMESVTYMTAGLLDKYENQDCDLESAIVRVFCSQKCLESVESCKQLIGSAAFIKDHWINDLYNDANGHVLVNETNDSLRIIIALMGLQYSGVKLNENVKKMRNPFYFPGYVLKKMFEQRRQSNDTPKLNLTLDNYVHPSLIPASQMLEYVVLRLQYATETMLITHGPEVISQHMELRRLADVAIDVYAMVSVISRSSRAYCIGLQNADSEIVATNTFCLDAMERVKRKVLEIIKGKYATNDANYQHVAKKALKFNSYFAEHVLTKNF